MSVPFPPPPRQAAPDSHSPASHAPGAEAPRPPAPRPVLTARGLRVAFGGRRVLDGLDLDLRAGEVFGLLGRNGAGKTTLIRTLCGRVRPGSGRVVLAGVELGRDRRTDADATRAIGLAPQDLGVYPHLTVRENLEVFGRLSGLTRRAISPALARAAERAKLTHRLEDVVGTLSGGYRRRVNIAAAILHEPKLLILDEPTVGLDLDAIAAVAALVRDLASDGMAALLVTHDLELAQGLCRRVGFLHGGRLEPVGEPAALVALAFKGRREIAIRLNAEAGPGGRAVLGSLGLKPEGSGRLWTGTTGDETISYADVALGLRDAGLSVREVRVRDPDLESLFKRVLGAGEGGATSDAPPCAKLTEAEAGSTHPRRPGRSEAESRDLSPDVARAGAASEPRAEDGPGSRPGRRGGAGAPPAVGAPAPPGDAPAVPSPGSGLAA